MNIVGAKKRSSLKRNKGRKNELNKIVFSYSQYLHPVYIQIMWSVGHLAGQFVERLVSQLLGGNTADRCVGARPATTDPLVHARSLTADLVG